MRPAKKNDPLLMREKGEQIAPVFTARAFEALVHWQRPAHAKKRLQCRNHPENAQVQLCYFETFHEYTKLHAIYCQSSTPHPAARMLPCPTDQASAPPTFAACALPGYARLSSSSTRGRQTCIQGFLEGLHSRQELFLRQHDSNERASASKITFSSQTRTQIQACGVHILRNSFQHWECRYLSHQSMPKSRSCRARPRSRRFCEVGPPAPTSLQPCA